MAEVQSFTIPGVKMWIISGDPHDEPHLHARRRGEWEVRVYLERPEDSMIEIIRPPDEWPRGTHRKAIVNGVAKHRIELLKEWEKCQGN